MNTQLLSRFETFVHTLTDTDRIAFLHDADCDGICSSVIAATALERFFNKKIVLRLFPTGKRTLQQSHVAKLKEENITKLFTFDMSVEQEMSLLKEIEVFADILIIDHHKILADANSEKTVFIKAQHINTALDGARYPTTKLAYDLFSRFGDLSDLDWKCCVGLIADAQYMQWKEFVDTTLKKYGYPLKTGGIETIFGEVISVVTSLIIYDETHIPAFWDFFKKAQKPEEVLSSQYTQYKEIVQKEIEYWYNNHTRYMEKYGELYIITIHPALHVGSVVITRLSFNKYPDKTVIIIADDGNEFLHVSARRQDCKVPVNDLLAEACKGFHDASGGGHTPAAGAKVRKEDYQTFKEKLIRIHEKLRK